MDKERLTYAVAVDPALPPKDVEILVATVQSLHGVKFVRKIEPVDAAALDNARNVAGLQWRGALATLLASKELP